MRGHSGRRTFMRELCQALINLYDPRELRRNLLIEVLPLAPQEDAGLALRRLLVDAIEALKPDKGVPPQSTSWRTYHVLFQRYTEQCTQRQVATELGLSIRQLRRNQDEAREALADYLWLRYDLTSSALSIDETAPLLDGDEDEMPATEGMLSREEELLWLQRSASCEPTSARQMVQEVLWTAAPLVRALQVSVEPNIPDHLPPLAARITAFRQGLLSVLTAAIRMVPGGKVAIDAQADQRRLHITIGSQASGPVAGLGASGQGNELQMARQVVQVSGGELQILSGEESEQCFTARLSFPVVEQTPVLAIDDNPDALALFGRYVSDTHYRLVGVSDLPHALSLLDKLAPKIIILDVMLPGIDGWRLLGRLREHPKSRTIPIIVCTVLPQEQLALTLGAAGFLRKPVMRAAFLAALDAQVEPRPRERR